MNQTKKVSILGFGFSGLSASWAYLKEGYEVEVFEKSDKIGGLLQTKKTDLGIIESAANAILKSKNVELMARDFKITWAERKKTIHKKWIFTDKPHRWPLSFSETARSFWPILQLARKNPKYRPNEQETVTAWGLRTFGSKSFVDQLLGPALQGIYAQGPDSLSATLCLKALFLSKPIRHQGSFAPQNGMSEFFEKGLVYLNKNSKFKIHMNSSFNSDIYLSDKPKVDYKIQSQDESKIDLNLFDSDLIVDSRPDYTNVKYLSVTSVTLFFEKEDRPKFEGFGCLFAKSKNILGVLFNSDIFEGRSSDHTFSETWIVSDDYLDDTETVDDVLDFREKKFGKSKRPVFYSVTHWPQAIPNYDLNHERFLKDAFKSVIQKPGQTLIKIGNYTGEIGLNKILENNVKISKMVF